MPPTQTVLFSDLDTADINARTSSTFADNMRLPVHRWFRYSAGFSAAWVAKAIREAAGPHPAGVFDPFAGSGTTLLAAQQAGMPSYGIEAHPFIYRVARAKLFHTTSVDDYKQCIRAVCQQARRCKVTPTDYAPLIEKCYTASALADLHALKVSLEQNRDQSPAWELAWLTLAGILRITSGVGTAQWQYILPKKEKKRTLEPFDAFDSLSKTFARDMQAAPEGASHADPQLLLGDARTCAGVPDDFATLVVTSPPYPNNYDYADATRLEMCFFGEINGWGDLQDAVRKHLVRSCSQHVPSSTVDLKQQLANEELSPIRPAIAEVCEALSDIRLSKGGKKTYHLMVACYFSDLAKVWYALRRVCAKGAKVCFVIGDSAPYGIYVPVMEWLGQLAIAAGFHKFSFEKTRDRNIKWKNRKHRVPLCEGRLWVEG